MPIDEETKAKRQHHERCGIIVSREDGYQRCNQCEQNPKVMKVRPSAKEFKHAAMLMHRFYEAVKGLGRGSC